MVRRDVARRCRGEQFRPLFADHVSRAAIDRSARRLAATEYSGDRPKSGEDGVQGGLQGDFDQLVDDVVEHVRERLAGRFAFADIVYETGQYGIGQFLDVVIGFFLAGEGFIEGVVGFNDAFDLQAFFLGCCRAGCTQGVCDGLLFVCEADKRLLELQRLDQLDDRLAFAFGGIGGLLAGRKLLARCFLGILPRLNFCVGRDRRFLGDAQLLARLFGQGRIGERLGIAMTFSTAVSSKKSASV
jgi:hypothetical protein